MKQNIKNVFLLVLLGFSICTPTNFLNAQEVGGLTPSDPDTPIDGGVGILVAAGIAYGAKKIRDERKKKANNTQ